MAESRPRQNFSKCCEEGINKQINLELYASYVYQSMAYYFDRDDVALKGFFEFFKKRSEEEKEHAEKFMKYQNKRGGRIILKPIEKPAHDAWGGGLRAVEISLDLEKDVNAALLKLHKIAEESGDPQMMDFIESEFLGEQVDDIKLLSDHITNLERVGKGLGEYIFDKNLDS
ncbi:soma ferritin-like isoform X2 [Octopus vulgaris]|uniref:Soma ferritin-like isoform X2 n=2 Tax=Octopus TaxID=6643 RepID=A0AA36BRQ0_OCTVU|nr:soma ferritin-like isoform X2 [Octopus sinensis]CAI9738884.1 soma ferritin-like isoform X2 [Octopus vulgaris]